MASDLRKTIVIFKKEGDLETFDEDQLIKISTMGFDEVKERLERKVDVKKINKERERKKYKVERFNKVCASIANDTKLVDEYIKDIKACISKGK